MKQAAFLFLVATIANLFVRFIWNGVVEQDWTIGGSDVVQALMVSVILSAVYRNRTKPR